MAQYSLPTGKSDDVPLTNKSLIQRYSFIALFRHRQNCTLMHGNFKSFHAHCSHVFAANMEAVLCENFWIGQNRTTEQYPGQFDTEQYCCHVGQIQSFMHEFRLLCIKVHKSFHGESDNVSASVGSLQKM